MAIPKGLDGFSWFRPFGAGGFVGRSFGLFVPIMDIRSACRFVVVDWMCLRKEVSQILDSCTPVHFELSCCDPVLDPVVPHSC